MDDSRERVPWRFRLERLIARVVMIVSRLGALIVWPFELCLEYFLRLVVGGVERTENAGFYLSGALWWLLAPLRWMWYLCLRALGLVRDYVTWPVEVFFVKTARLIFGGVEQVENQEFALTRARWTLATRWRALRQAISETTGIPWLIGTIIMAPFAATAYLTQALIRILTRLVEFLNLDGVIGWLVHWTRPLWYPVVAVGAFIWAWFVTRNRRQLAWAIPLALVLAPAAWVLAGKIVWGESHVADQYRAAVAVAREAKAFDHVQLYERKLAQLGVNTDVTKFRTALELAQAGEMEAAYERMRGIAPEDRPGYANAHYWIIESLLAQRLKTPADSSHELAGRHLDRLADLGVRGAGVDVLRAVWLAQGGQAAEATALLEPLVHAHPFAAIERMRLNLMLDRKSEARGDAVIVADNMERAKRGGKTLTADDFRWWCMAEDVLARKARLLAILNDWLKLEPHNNDALTLASQFGLVELDEAIRERTTDPRQLVDSIRRLFASGDPPAEARGRIAELYRSRSDIAALNEAFGLLLQSTDLPSTLAEVLGTAAATEEDWKVAQPLLEQTVRQTPGNFAAWNNLAYVLLKQNQDLDRALMAAEKALGSNSNNFHFRETRGQILAKLHRWQDAVTDLEFALNGIPQGKNIHASLAQAYAALGNAELAATHAQHSQ